MNGSWYGEDCNIGLHYDLHASEGDTDLGTRVDDNLAELLALLDVDFVQTDTKGHPGYLSWFSQLPVSSMPPGLTADALAGWRGVTRRLGLPLHSHYSGIWDKAAGKRFPDWCVQPAPDSEQSGGGQNSGGDTPGEIMCVRRGYVDGLLLLQLRELIERYGVDGFWIDGDLWAVKPCYCDRCRAAFAAAHPGVAMPLSEQDPNWPLMWNFMLQGFQDYVRHYCDELHRDFPQVKICSNWLSTYRNPGNFDLPTDWISGDNSHIWGIDTSRCEARFLAQRGKPWDIMLWCFSSNNGFGRPESPWIFKPVETLEQEIAVLLSFGGNIQLYEAAFGVRDGRLSPWRIQRLKTVVEFIRRRLPLCKGATSVPQVAVLHSEHHFYANVKGHNLLFGGDITPVNGAIFMTLENHFHADLLDEWALLPRLSEYPVVVVPEQHDLSEAMVAALKSYVAAGGRLLLTGARIFDRFGAEFIGAESVEVREKAQFYLPVADGAAPVYCDQWRLLKPTTGRMLGELYTAGRIGDDASGYPAAVLHAVGRGQVAYIPAAIGHEFEFNRVIEVRQFFGEVLRAVAGPLLLRVDAPTCVDVALRRKPGQLLTHLINRAGGIPNLPNQGMVAEIPPVGPVTVHLALPRPPQAVYAAWEGGSVTWDYRDGELTVTLPTLKLYEAIVVTTE